MRSVNGTDRRGRLSIARRGVISALLLVVGTLVLNVLNGQTYSNAIVFLAFCVASSAPWVPLAFQSQHRPRRALAVCILIGHLILLAIVAQSLPRRAEFQRTFNENVQKLRTGQLNPHASPATVPAR